LAVESLPRLTRHHSHLERIRLALELGDCKVFIGRDADDGLHLMLRYREGGGASGGKRWVLREHGAIVMRVSNLQRVIVSGVVADEVTAVRVGDVPAYLRSNGFLVEIGPDESPVVVVTALGGEREVGPHAA
jgi:hypothetical protein